MIEQVSYITPNEHEATLLFEGKEKEEVLKQYPNKLFITEGKQGVRYFNGEKEVLVPSYQVETIDTTGAGDTFNAALAVALAEGMGFEKEFSLLIAQLRYPSLNLVRKAACRLEKKWRRVCK